MNKHNPNCEGCTGCEMPCLDEMRGSLTKESHAIMALSNNPRETCAYAIGKEEPMFSFEFIKGDESSYIHEHLEFLRFLTKMVKPDKILEIGTGNGHSTAFFAAGCMENGKGNVITLDIDDCGKAKDLILDNDMDHVVTFIKGNSLDLNIDGTIDILFIDGSHEYWQVKKELEKFTPMLSYNGWVVLHDTANPAHEGVHQAVKEWFNSRFDQYERYEFFHCNGLTVFHQRDGGD